MAPRDPLTLSALSAQHELVSQQIISIQSARNHVMSLLGAGIGGAFLFGIVRRAEVVLLAVPIAAAFLGLYGLYLYNLNMALLGYRRALEEEMNRHLGEAVYVLEKLLTEKVYGGPITRALQVGAILFFVAAVAIAFVVGQSLIGPWAYVTLFVYLALGGGLAWWARRPQQSYRAALESLRAVRRGEVTIVSGAEESR